MQTGRIEETIHFAERDEARLTYALEHSATVTELMIRYRPQEVTVMLTTEAARTWSESDQVGVHSDLAVRDEVLTVLIEKDFACLDGSNIDNEDTFENPNLGAVC